ncbi:hypothetical protein JCM19239_7986 [Vibrio variabilis]|uniref:Uncharacterized protein n=1 Tax=Vibrio variabilis TaxID=990271 RepID=A0ABQ0JGN4_9VIBR|nr:hypothetical protein JCM19239_7986 [Vibrio variabilis]
MFASVLYGLAALSTTVVGLLAQDLIVASYGHSKCVALAAVFKRAPLYRLDIE